MSFLDEYKKDLHDLNASLLNRLGIVMIAENRTLYEDAPRLVVDTQFGALITDDTVDIINAFIRGENETIDSEGEGSGN